MSKTGQGSRSVNWSSTELPWANDGSTWADLHISKEKLGIWTYWWKFLISENWKLIQKRKHSLSQEIPFITNLIHLHTQGSLSGTNSTTKMKSGTYKWEPYKLLREDGKTRGTLVMCGFSLASEYNASVLVLNGQSERMLRGFLGSLMERKK